MKLFSMLNIFAFIFFACLIFITNAARPNIKQSDKIFRNVQISDDLIDLTNLNATGDIFETSKKTLKAPIKFTYNIGNLEYFPSGDKNEIFKSKSLGIMQLNENNKNILNNFIKFAKTNEVELLTAEENPITRDTINATSAEGSAGDGIRSLFGDVNVDINNATIIKPEFVIARGNMDRTVINNMLDCVSKMDYNHTFVKNENLCNEFAQAIVKENIIEDPNEVYEACMDELNN